LSIETLEDENILIRNPHQVSPHRGDAHGFSHVVCNRFECDDPVLVPGGRKFGDTQIPTRQEDRGLRPSATQRVAADV
jgi:hypothetical protein